MCGRETHTAKVSMRGVHCDWCDSCDRWTGTARCCFSRGQMPTCLWFVLMLTRGADSAHLIDHKMAAS